jgi:hypothetical protein
LKAKEGQPDSVHIIKVPHRERRRVVRNQVDDAKTGDTDRHYLLNLTRDHLHNTGESFTECDFCWLHIGVFTVKMFDYMMVVTHTTR